MKTFVALIFVALMMAFTVAQHGGPYGGINQGMGHGKRSIPQMDCSVCPPGVSCSIICTNGDCQTRCGNEKSVTNNCKTCPPGSRCVTICQNDDCTNTCEN